jgi:hypothetical protein
VSVAPQRRFLNPPVFNCVWHYRSTAIVYAHQLQVSIGQCIADLELVAKTGGEADPRGHVIYLPLG